MKKILAHIVIKSVAFVLVMTILAPSIVKIAHALDAHEHVVCTSDIDTHIHQIDLDCEFYKFNSNHNFTLVENNFEFYTPIIAKNKANNHYNFISDYQRLHFSLRGPPIYN